MLILRLIGVLALLSIAAAVALFFYTRNRRYLTWAWRIFQYSIVVTVVVLVLYALERLLVAV